MAITLVRSIEGTYCPMRENRRTRVLPLIPYIVYPTTNATALVLDNVRIKKPVMIMMYAQHRVVRGPK